MSVCVWEGKGGSPSNLEQEKGEMMLTFVEHLLSAMHRAQCFLHYMY